MNGKQKAIQEWLETGMDEKKTGPAQEWLETAVKGIRFWPDRWAVEAELREHLEDKTADMARIFHIEGEEAEREALKRMGDPEEIGKKLAKIHKPWLGYLWLASKIACIVLITLALLYSMVLDHYGDNVQGGMGYTNARNLKPISAAEPAQVELGNYTFRVVEAFQDSNGTVQVTVRASSPRFWERIAMVSDSQVTVILEDGTRLDLDAEFDISDERAAYARLYDYWNTFSRDIRIYIHNTPCRIGDWVTVEMRFPLGTVVLSAEISERGVLF